MDVSALAAAVVALVQPHAPWLIDKLGGAVATQTVKEVWEKVKTKLGATATEKVEAMPDDAQQWEVLKSRLVVALADDAEFAKVLQELVGKSQVQVGIVQNVSGDGTIVTAVQGSSDVKISIG